MVTSWCSRRFLFLLEAHLQSLNPQILTTVNNPLALKSIES